MKILLTSFFLFISVLLSDAQTIVIQNEMHRTLYKGVVNPLSFMVKNIPCKSMIFKTNNEIIERSDCNLMVIPKMFGWITIDIYRKKGKKEKFLASRYFEVDDLPLPKANIGNLTSDTIKKDMLLRMGGVIARLENSTFDAPFEVKEYTITIIKKDFSSKSLLNIGARFTTDIMEFLQLLESGDKLIIAGINVVGPSGRLRRLHALEKVIVD